MTSVTPIRVVVSNDNRLLRSVLRHALIEEGFDVVGEGANADDTIAVVRAASPDVLITDIHKPGMYGPSR